MYNSTFSPKKPVALSGRVTQAEMFVLEKFEEIVPKVKGVSQDIIETIRNFDFTIFGIPLFARPSLDTLKHFGSASATDRWLLLIPLLSALTSLMTSILTQKRQEKTGQDTAQLKQMSCLMMFMMPLMSLWISFSLPAAVGIYWIISNVLAFFQTLVLGYTHAPRRVLARLMVEETIERRSKEENIKLMAKNNFEN